MSTKSSGRSYFRSKSRDKNNFKTGNQNQHDSSSSKNDDSAFVKEGSHRAMNNRNVSNHRPQFRRQDSSGQLNAHKTTNKRRVTFSGWQDIKCLRKRRRVNSVALPTKFLLGGNINDPLNLKSLEDEEVNRQLNACTPASSPVPASKRRTQVQILIPTNIYDPLNLNTGEEIEFNIISPRTRKRKRHRRSGSRKEEIDVNKHVKCEEESCDKCANFQNNFVSSLEVKTEKVEDIAVCETVATKNDTNLPETSSSCEQVEQRTNEKARSFLPEKLKTSHNERIKSHCEKIKIIQSEKCSDIFVSKPDKIVSPVVPQGSKFYNRHPQALSSSKGDRKRRQSKKITFFKDLQFKPQNSRFRYGSNPSRYYCTRVQDVRFKFFTKALFSGKDILDVGCNVGCVSSLIGEHYEPKKVIGIDIDPEAISIAQKHVLQHVNSSVNKKEKFPTSFALSLGPLYRISLALEGTDPNKFPHNLSFVQENYVLNSDEELQMVQPEYDVILCLRTTKWIHLNCGDEGLKRAFKRMFAQLRYGGQLILEPQPWLAYTKTRKLTETIYKNYNSIQLKPEKFLEYLLSKEVGFTSCKVMGRIINYRRGYMQSLYILTKVMSFSPAQDMPQSEVVSPVVFNDIEWARSCEDEQDSTSEWESNVCGNPSPVDFVSPPEDNESSQCDLYTGSEMFMDDSYFFPPDYDNIQELYE